MSTTIYALIICLQFNDPNFAKASGCSFPENGMTTFPTADACLSYVERTNRISDINRGLKDGLTEYKCVSRATDRPWSLIK